jgi:hypothetical protein
VTARTELADAMRTATISDCSRYRYRLGRRWGGGSPLLFVMLNPSTADALQDDATIRRCTTFALAHGFEALQVVNLYAWRATDPADLWRAAEPVGPEADRHIAEAAAEAGAVCIAWGAQPKAEGRVQQVLPLLRRSYRGEIQCLRITRSGYPQHPLYLPSSCRLQPFSHEAIQEAMEP